MKRTFLHFLQLILLAICFITGCQGGKDTVSILEEAETLIYESPDSALRLLESIPHPERLQGKEQADYALLLTQARSRCRITATSDSLIRIATSYYQSSTDHARKATTLLYLADVYMDMKKNTEAVVPLKQAEEIMEAAGPSIQYLIYSKLGFLNRKSGNYGLALEYYQKAMDRSNQNTEWYVSALVNILNLPISEVQDSASVYIKQLETRLSDAHPDLQAKAYNNIGVYYEDMQQKETAVLYYQKAIRTSSSVPYRAYQNLARIYDGWGDIVRSDSLYQVALQTPVWSTKAQIYEVLYKRSLDAGRHQEAIKYLEQYQAATDSFYTHRQVQAIQELQMKYDYEVLSRAKVEAENQLLRYSLIGGVLFICLAVMAYVIYSYFKRQYIRQLQELESQIEEINNLKDEKTMMQDKVRELNESLRHSKILSDEYLQLKGEWTSKEDIQALGLYIRLRRNLSLYHSSDFSALAHWLDIVSGQFASRLRAAHPSLTAAELTVCYLHRMGYAPTDMAQAMHVKSDTIIRYIYRVCSKMDITQNKTHFSEYILHF